MKLFKLTIKSSYKMIELVFSLLFMIFHWWLVTCIGLLRLLWIPKLLLFLLFCHQFFQLLLATNTTNAIRPCSIWPSGCGCRLGCFGGHIGLTLCVIQRLFIILNGVFFYFLFFPLVSCLMSLVLYCFCCCFSFFFVSFLCLSRLEKPMKIKVFFSVGKCFSPRNFRFDT